MQTTRNLSQRQWVIHQSIAHGYSVIMTGIQLPSSSKFSRYFFFLSSFYYWYCLRLQAMLSNHFLEHQRYLAYITYYWSMKASLQIGSKWGRTVLIPASILHLMLGLHCLVSIMIWQMSHHLLFSAQVCSECNITYPFQISSWSYNEGFIHQALFHAPIPSGHHTQYP